MAVELGTPLMPWQRHVADVALELESDGSGFRYTDVLVSVQRQSGKTTLLRPVQAHRCMMMRDAAVWLTAQKRDSARDTWMQTVKHLERAPALQRALRVRRANGSESVIWGNGSELRPFAPSEEALHGKWSDLVFCDEIWAFDAAQGKKLMQAIVPTMATRPFAQTWYVSTAGTARSTWLRPMVERARADLAAGRPTRTAFFEWGIPDGVEDLTDLDVFASYHPAVGHTISRRSLEAAASQMDPAEFARAYGNYWVSSDSFAINPALWARAETLEPIDAVADVSFAVEVFADRSGAAIVVAGRTGSGLVAVEVVDQRPGVGWLTERVLGLVARHRPVSVVIDPHGPARTLHAALSEQRTRPVPLMDFGAADLISAHGEFLDALTEGTIRQRPDRAGALAGALAAASVRAVREQEVLSRVMGADGASPAALVAAELAAYGLAHPVGRPVAPMLRIAGRDGTS